MEEMAGIVGVCLLWSARSLVRGSILESVKVILMKITSKGK